MRPHGRPVGPAALTTPTTSLLKARGLSHTRASLTIARKLARRCIDHLRRPTPPPADIFDVSRTPLHDPLEEALRWTVLRVLPLVVRGRLIAVR